MPKIKVHVCTNRRTCKSRCSVTTWSLRQRFDILPINSDSCHHSARLELNQIHAAEVNPVNRTRESRTTPYTHVHKFELYETGANVCESGSQAARSVERTLHRARAHTFLSVACDWPSSTHMRPLLKLNMDEGAQTGGERGKKSKRDATRMIVKRKEKTREVQDASLCYFCHVRRIHWLLHTSVLTSRNANIIGKRWEKRNERG